MSDETTPTPNIPPSPNDEPPVSATPQATPVDEGTIKMTSEQLNARLERERQATFRRLGLEGEDDVKKLQEEREALLKQKEEEERAKMSELDRYRTDLATAEQERAQAEERYAAAQFENHVSKVCAEMGIRNVEYAMFEVMRAADEVPEGETMDVADHLKQLAEADASKRASLGLASPPPPVEPAAAPATTAPEGQQPAPPPPGAPPAEKDAFAMNDEEWKARQAAIGI